MSIKALEENLKAAVGILAQDHAVATVNGTGIDTRGYDEALIILNAGTATATGTADVKLQESSDDDVADTYADITGAAFTQVTAANDETVYVGRIRVKNFERYIRVVSVVGTDTVELGVSVILGKFDGLAPVSQDNTVAFALDYVSDGGTASV